MQTHSYLLRLIDWSWLMLIDLHLQMLTGLS